VSRLFAIPVRRDPRTGTWIWRWSIRSTRTRWPRCRSTSVPNVRPVLAPLGEIERALAFLGEPAVLPDDDAPAMLLSNPKPDRRRLPADRDEIAMPLVRRSRNSIGPPPLGGSMPRRSAR